MLIISIKLDDLYNSYKLLSKNEFKTGNKRPSDNISKKAAIIIKKINNKNLNLENNINKFVILKKLCFCLIITYLV